MFTEKEIAYLKSQPLARIATVSLDAQPWTSNCVSSCWERVRNSSGVRQGMFHI
jgi:hypothetical protein